MLKRVLVVLLLCLPPHGHGDGHSPPPTILRDIDEGQELLEFTHVALDMTRRFISQRTNTLVIMEKCEYFCREHQRYHVALLQSFLQNISSTISVQLFSGQPDDRPWDYNLFVVDSWFAFESLRFRFPVTKHERQFFFYILLTWHVSDYHAVHSQMSTIFIMCLRFSVKNVVIMVKLPHRHYISFYTYQLFGSDHCQDEISIHEINRYENGQLQRDVLFPDHMSNFHGCSLTVSGHIMEPLLTFNGDFSNETHLNDKRRLAGVEGEILKLLAETMNMNLKLRFPRELSLLKMYSNASECFDDLQQHRAQIAIGGLSPLSPKGNKFTYSFVYHTSPYVFVVRGGLLFGPIKQLLNPLSSGTWLVVLVAWLIAIAVIEIIERVRRPILRNFVFGPPNKYPLRNMIVAFLGSPLPTSVMPRRNFARFLLMSWLIFTFELRNGYQGKMFDSLRLGKRRPIPVKISELLDLDYTLLTNVAVDFYPANKTRIVSNAAVRLNLVNTSERRLTTTALLDYLISYNVKKSRTSSLNYVNENIYFYQCVMFFNKHSILAASFDRKLKQLSDAGITAYIAKRHVHWHKRIMNDRSQAEPGATRITNQNLIGLYSIYGILCEIAIMAFVLELLAKKSRRLKIFMDWLN